MSHVLILVPVAADVNVRPTLNILETFFTQNDFRANALPGLDLNAIENFLTAAHRDQLLENLVMQYENVAPHAQIIFLSGVPISKHYALELNFAIATTFRATILFVLEAEEKNFANLWSLQIASDHYRERYPYIVQYLALDNNHLQQVAAMPQYQKLLENKWPLVLKLNEQSSLVELQKLIINLPPLPLTPPFFRYRLEQKARSLVQTIILPEGDEPRTIKAANFCAKRGIARCILLAPREKIVAVCNKLQLELHPAIEIIEPKAALIEKYVTPLYELRSEKGLTVDAARQQLQDRVTLGLMMLHTGEVDGLVAGAVNTTADILRPALQIIKLAPEVKRASSIFFMCLPAQVLVYGDCAVNTDPTAEELADIAIQSAASAQAFGLSPKVAMLSYSSYDSSGGPSVDKVKEATTIAKTLRPDLMIEGPLQFDAAVSEQVAKIKCPASKIAGEATVFIVPNLDVGNILYKAVQWVAGVMCIGPMLQGLSKPVNDLSRGCREEDIVFTIAVTAVQAITKGVKSAM